MTTEVGGSRRFNPADLFRILLSKMNNSVKDYDASTLTDEELAMKAQEELNMEGEMEEVSLSVLSWTYVL